MLLRCIYECIQYVFLLDLSTTTAAKVHRASTRWKMGLEEVGGVGVRLARRIFKGWADCGIGLEK